ncbi:MAG: hypothetical protein RL199_2296 [Pseudomonadota bacterium]|jgi:hypothetical protein
MRLFSDDGLGRLEVSVCDLEPGPAPRIGLFWKVQLGGFSGERRAWFAVSDLARFAMEIEAMDSVSDGAAVLDGAEPGTIRWTLLPNPHDPGVVAHVSMMLRQKVGGRSYETSLTGVTALPPAAIRSALESLRRWRDPAFLSELADWGFDEKALVEG